MGKASRACSGLPAIDLGGSLHHIAVHLFRIFARLAGFGLLGLGILDSSFLVMPLGNDLLIIALTARHHARLLYYAFMAAAGSTLGVLLIDTISRKGGERGLEGRVPAKRLDYVKCKVDKHGAWALAVASIMPPPFPFTPFVVVTAALQYPRKKLLSIIAVSRFVRFTAEGVLAIFFGRHILALARTPTFQYFMVGFVALCIVGSVFSILSWTRKSKHILKAAG